MENGSEMKEREHRFYFSKKMKIVLFSLLIGLNIILRIPFYPHESGADTFIMHILANSVSQFGHAMYGMVTRFRPASDNREDAEKTLEAC